MAYDVPGAADLILRYPAFSAVDTAVIDYWITDAQRFVDTGWIEGDFAPALMALAAHNMAMAGIGTSGGGIPAGVTRFRSGAMDVAIADAAAVQQSKGGFQATRYGQEFAMLQRRNFGGPRVVAAGRVPAGPCGGSIICGNS